MLKFCSLYSGSSGNSFLVQDNETNILIDCGVSGKKIIEALTSINVPIESICAILVTHEHVDHTQSLGTLSKKYNIPVYANYETWNAMPTQKDKISDNNMFYFKNNVEFKINDLHIYPFDIPHDAANPCGFNISNNNSKISIATDIGHLSGNILDNLKNSNFLLLESNYEPEVLKCSSYPYKLKQRIASSTGHLSNIEAGKAIAYLSKFGTNNIMLGHLSKENNFPELAYKSVCEEIANNNCDLSNINLNIASRYEPSNFFEVG